MYALLHIRPCWMYFRYDIVALMRLNIGTIIKILHIIITNAGCSRRESRNTGTSPFSFTRSVLGSFTCITQHTGPTALRPIRRTKQLWLSVLLKDTSSATGQAGIRTHILTTPELESNAPDRSTTTFVRKVVMEQSYRIKLFFLSALSLKYSYKFGSITVLRCVLNSLKVFSNLWIQFSQKHEGQIQVQCYVYPLLQIQSRVKVWYLDLPWR